MITPTVLRPDSFDELDSVIHVNRTSLKTRSLHELARKFFHVHTPEFEQIKQSANLIDESDCDSEKLLNHQIIYLVLLSQDPDGKCPLSKEHEKGFLKSMRMTHTAQSWLWNGLYANQAMICCTEVTGIGVSVGAAFCLTAPVAITLQLSLAAIKCVTNNVGNVISWAATGIYPDLSSRDDDIKAFVAREAKTQYTAIASKLIELYFEYKTKNKHLRIQEIIEKIDVNLLNSKIKNDLQGNGYANDIIDPLKHAIEWIQSSKLPLNTILRNSIETYKIKYAQPRIP